ncbi:MAG TPA: Ig-like domain-containing protein [Planctomycetota bacterium]|nr:Ig-like domain-containing protein [Planctomycetota bacterium]
MAGALALAGAIACSPPSPEPIPLRLLQASPEAGASGVFLNERVVLDFSRPLDPASLHTRSARVVDSQGRFARGQWTVQGARLTFTPDPVLSSTLDDGGYRPGERYRVELAGFPRPDGLRSSDGSPLERGHAWEFAVVVIGSGTRHGFLFEDASMDTGRPLMLRSERIGPRDPILLEGGEPVDPSTLFAADFVLQAWRSGGGADTAAGGQATELIERLEVRARLLDNRDRRSAHGSGSTWIELQPLAPLRAGPDVVYQLHLAPNARLRDFGGHPVLLAPRAGTSLSHLTVVEEGARAPSVYSEHFLGIDNRSPLAVPGTDGTAWWGGDSGRVEVRFLAAAGDGRAGDVTLGEVLEDLDLHALRVDQPTAVTTTIEVGRSCVVLRAQGSLRLEGKLSRRGGHTSLEDFHSGESLSAWIERMQAEERPVTVLVASGDIVLAGEVDLDGPLVLAAGGRVRLVGPRMARASSLYVVGDRGGQGSFEGALPEALAGSPPPILPILSAPLELDPPTHNPLVEPLTFAVRSGPIPRRGRVRRWHPLQVAPGGRAGAGAFRVRFVGERSAAAGSGEVLVDDPMRLEDCPTLRLQVELRVEPGPTWDPPWVDFVELSWDSAEAGGDG